MGVTQAIRSYKEYKFQIAISDGRMKFTIISHCVISNQYAMSVLSSNVQHFASPCYRKVMPRYAVTISANDGINSKYQSLLNLLLSLPR